MTQLATGSGGLTGLRMRDGCNRDGAVESTGLIWFIPAKVGVQDPQFAIEGLLNYAMALDNPTLNKLSEEIRLQIILTQNFALLIIPCLRQVKARCEHCAGTGFHNVLREVGEALQ